MIRCTVYATQQCVPCCECSSRHTPSRVLASILQVVDAISACYLCGTASARVTAVALAFLLRGFFYLLYQVSHMLKPQQTTLELHTEPAGVWQTDRVGLLICMLSCATYLRMTYKLHARHSPCRGSCTVLRLRRGTAGVGVAAMDAEKVALCCLLGMRG